MSSDFDWSPQPRAAAWVAATSSELRHRLPFAEIVKNRLLTEAGVRFDDLIGRIFISGDAGRVAGAIAAGWTRSGEAGGFELYCNSAGIFPPIAADAKAERPYIAIHLNVESIADFLQAWKLPMRIDGEASSRMRSATLQEKPDAIFRVTQELAMHGLWQAYSISKKKIIDVRGRFQRRRRDSDDESEGFDYTDRLLGDAIAEVGRDIACQLFFTAEREYWMSRNAAGRAQYTRQQKLGIGWANHDHHTYRSSRKYFSRLIGLWEKLGFICRERFYAGREAGWGAQILEHPATGIVTFNDLDLSPDEIRGDFAHDPLAPGNSLGTVGLWCGLHGESLLQAGMHHLEAQFSFDALRDQLAEEQIKMGKPFTDFPYLRQAFTEGERWPVAEKRIAALLAEKLITPDQAEKFRAQGAIGSHLENLERNDGFKGFNQTGVSEIITATDPRKNLARA